MRDSDDATVAPAVDRIRSRTNAAEMSPIIASAPPLHCTDAVTGCSMSEGAGAGASSVFAYVICMYSISDSEVEGGDEVGRLGDDVAELARRQLPVVVDVGLEEHLRNGTGKEDRG